MDHSVWAAPIFADPKKDSKCRICGDYKVSLDRFLDVDQYPLSKPADLFATLSAGQVLIKLNLTQAYQQLLLNDSLQQFTTINTHWRLYRYIK